MSTILREIAIHCVEGKSLSEVLSWVNDLEGWDRMDL